MILRMWSTDADGNIQQDDENEEIEVTSVEDATAKIVEDLYSTASDKFMHEALSQWFLNRKIDNLDAGHQVFWNVALEY